MLEIELPYPPSVNHYWRHFRGRTVISASGLKFRQAVGVLLRRHRIEPLVGRLVVAVTAYPPDERRRDVDNLLKALGDALEHGGAFQDDSQIVWLLIAKAQVVPGGKVVVRLRSLAEGQMAPDPATAWSAAQN